MSQSQTIQAIRGMNDILPDEAELWEQFDEIVRDWLHAYGYRSIRMPLVEPTQLFARAIGVATDIVEKEMYSFTDSLNGEQLTLRPEGTASCVRAVLQHNLLYDGPKRLWYQGPMFRHERPQKGRYRQFHQVGIEAMGYAGPDIDAEQILMCRRLWDDLGIGNVPLELNSLGQPDERKQHRGDLISYLEAHADALDDDGKRRLYSNPLRILDSKNPTMQDLIEGAPKLIDYLGDESLGHFEGVQTLLKDAGIAFCVNPRLVRGLDYYNLTVFEWITDQLGSQGTICAGGRYDGLIEQLGGKPSPACGFALGIERLLSLWRGTGRQTVGRSCDVYVVHQGSDVQRFAFRVAEILRDAGYATLLHCGGGSFKTQLKRADASGAPLAVIIGEDETRASEVSVKPLRVAVNRPQAEQRRVAVGQIAELVGTLLFEEEDEHGRV